MRLYLDACAIIYAVEGDPGLRERVLAFATQAEEGESGAILTSRLSRVECRVKPLRENQEGLLATYDAFFSRHGLDIVEITPTIVELAAELRARHGLKTPDALHIATAVERRAELFLTPIKRSRAARILSESSSSDRIRSRLCSSTLR